MNVIQKISLLLIAACSTLIAQESATVQGPEVVKAGEILELDISLDRAANVEGAIIIFIEGPGTFNLQTSCALPAGRKSCHFGFRIAEDAPSGTGYVSKLKFQTGIRSIDLPFDKVAFRVVARTEPFIFPTRAEVTVKPTQAQLLRGEATRLQEQLQALKASVEGAKSMA